MSISVTVTIALCAVDAQTFKVFLFSAERPSACLRMAPRTMDLHQRERYQLTEDVSLQNGEFINTLSSAECKFTSRQKGIVSPYNQVEYIGKFVNTKICYSPIHQHKSVAGYLFVKDSREVTTL